MKYKSAHMLQKRNILVGWVLLCISVSDRASNWPQKEGNARCLSAFMSHESLT